MGPSINHQHHRFKTCDRRLSAHNIYRESRFRWIIHRYFIVTNCLVALTLFCATFTQPVSAQAVDLGWQTVNHRPNQPLNLTIPTDLPDGVNDIKFYLIKRQSETSRSEKFGTSGVHAEWDLLPKLVEISNQYYGSNKTGDDLLNRHFAMLAAIGLEWVRADQSWERIEPQKGQFDFSKTDKIVAAAQRYNIRLAWSLSYTPLWLSNQCSTTSLPKHFRSPHDTTLESGSQYYNRFAQKVVERYQPHGSFYPDSDYGIKHWQIWNEPDLDFWTDCDTGATGYVQPKYVALLKSAYPVIKSTDPQAQVLVGGMSHIDPQANLNHLYELIGQDKNFNLLDVHNYEDVETFTAKLRQVAAVRNGHGDADKKIWINETGFFNNAHDPNDPGQSNYLRATFERIEQLSAELNLGKAFWYGTRNYYLDLNNIPESDTSLFENNFYPRPVYFTLGEWLGTIDYLGEIPVPPTSQGQITLDIPGSQFAQTGEYVVFHASASKMVTDLPFIVNVSDTNPQPILTPNIGDSKLPGSNLGRLLFKIKPEGIIDPPSSLTFNYSLVRDSQTQSHSLTVTHQGNGVFQGVIDQITPGSYSLNLKPPRHLAKNYSDLTIDSGTNDFDFTQKPYTQTLFAGDVSGPNGQPNNQIDIYDIALIVSDLDRTGDPATLTADVDYDGAVTIYDISYIISNFDRQGE